MRWISILSGAVKCLFSDNVELVAENIALRE